ncbi:glutaredoxin family protein [Halobacillus mangrovi]|uniref:glutaredoxin family protein n=1 Tax=Halobacillus mangrovi TaxID=402384 RepID=UPI003D99BAB3
MNKIIVYKKDRCPLCEEVESLIDLLELDFTIEREEIDIETDEELLEKYMFEIPVLIVNGEEIEYRRIDYFSIKKRLH